MKHLGLFEGIGGFSLAARWMGWETVAWCEWKPYNQKLLKQHFPEAEGFGDITKSDFTKYKNAIDILTGGFPCQPYSTAGERKGKDDERHLWPEMLRTIREVSPPWVVGENVRGLTNWNGGVVFDEVQAQLEIEGYQILPFLLPACAKNADHERYRIWFIAYSERYGLERKVFLAGNPEPTNDKPPSESHPLVPLEGLHLRADCKELRANDGISNWVDRISGCGNAIVPQMALEIYKAIEAYERSARKK